MRPQQLVAALLGAALAPGAEASQSGVTAAYEAFRRQYGRHRSADTVGYEQRLALYQRHVEKVHRHNAQANKTWVAGINKFADYTDEEFHSLLGHRPSRWGSRGAAAGSSEVRASSFLEARPRQVLAQTVDWRQRLNMTANVKDQGNCGSCWAVAAVGALETHAEMAGTPARPLSYEQLVDCVENPRECGGQGGCKGATSELAFGYVQEHGLVAESEYRGYQSGGDGVCKPPRTTATKSEGFLQLPTNKLQPLMEAVATKGPVVVSVDASGWNMYQGGIYASCTRDATVNHAVLLVGYGTDDKLKKDYWTIRNSWGLGWGEKGYIRLERHASDEGEAGHCGTDRAPQEGVGCKDGPKEITVCGMCGVLSDSSFPTGVRGIANGATA